MIARQCAASRAKKQAGPVLRTKVPNAPHTHNPVSEGLGELTKELICCLPVDDVFRLSFASAACGGLCRVALRSLRLQAFGPAAAEALLRLVALQITDRGASIVEIDAAFCRSITNETLKALPVLPALEVLNLDGCQDVDDEGLIAVAQRCRSLRSFSIYWNVKATDEGIGKVLRAQPCGNLQVARSFALVAANFSPMPRCSVLWGGQRTCSDWTLRAAHECPRWALRSSARRCQSYAFCGSTQCCLCSRSWICAAAERKMQQSKPSSLPQSQAWGERPNEMLADGHSGSAVCCPGALNILNLTWCPALTDASMLAVAKHCTRCLAAQLDSAC
ncbi:unnamed protein product [Symbiodinium necroappetens]|uniref:F-box/LRR-repeat protein 15-like leucin rich repeat domain-containing protein n=1 Tax=Symbiodinium necroappetens TaxID=1628268 RepID=A0A812IXS2_9DINO|nr:unnamed protein product [Symbiodinium necroappetens]